jgi:hypothetical protein
LEQAEEARTSNAVAARAGIRIEVIGDLLGKDACNMDESSPGPDSRVYLVRAF